MTVARSRTRRRLALGAALTALVLVTELAIVPGALAKRAPTTSELTDIKAGVQGFFTTWYYPQGSTSHVTVRGVRVSTVDSDWAVAHVSGPKAAGRPALTPDYGTVLLVRVGADSDTAPSGKPARRWIVASAGYVGEYAWCGIAPDTVTKDLLGNPNIGC